MRIAFGAALPVGVGGTAEYFDLFLERYIAPDKRLPRCRTRALLILRRARART